MRSLLRLGLVAALMLTFVAAIGPVLASGSPGPAHASGPPRSGWSVRRIPASPRAATGVAAGDGQPLEPGAQAPTPGTPFAPPPHTPTPPPKPPPAPPTTNPRKIRHPTPTHVA